MVNHPRRAKKLTEAQIVALKTIAHVNDRQSRTSATRTAMGLGEATCQILLSRGLITSERISEGGPSLYSRVVWSITPAGRAALTGKDA